MSCASWADGITMNFRTLVGVSPTRINQLLFFGETPTRGETGFQNIAVAGVFTNHRSIAI